MGKEKRHCIEILFSIKARIELVRDNLAIAADIVNSWFGSNYL